MDPVRYLDLAKELVARVTRSDCLPGTAGEAECRSAISRAYYAAFLVASDLLDSIGIRVPESGVCHEVVKNGLNNSNDADLVAASSQLGTLGTERRQADYKLANTRPEKAAQAQAMTVVSDKVIATLRQRKRECQADATKKASLAATILGWAKTSGQALYPK